MKFAFPVATAAAFALAIPSVSLAQEPAAPAPPAAEEEDEVEDRVICKTFKVTGSRLAKRKVCRTNSEWKKHEEDTKDQVGQALARHAAAPGNE